MASAEKLAALGFPVTAGVAQVYGVDQMQLAPWSNQHILAGNTQHVAQADSWRTRLVFDVVG